MKLDRIPFDIIYSSSNDPDFPADNLKILNAPISGGWQSDRFCLFPQTLEIDLRKPVKIKRLQILSHHFKIPTRIDILAANQGDYNFAGFISMQNNSINGYKARELKSVHLDTLASRIRLVLYRCHVNTLNMYNQVGLVGIDILGITDSYISSVPNVVQSQNYESYISGEMENVDQDRLVVSAMAKVQKEKLDAVKDENFIKAKQLKELENLLIKVIYLIGRNSNQQIASQ